MTASRRTADSIEAAACHQRGLEFLRAGEAVRSIAEFEHAVALDPANADFHNALGNARKAAGNLTEAVASYRHSLEISPDHIPPRYNLGLALLDLNQPDQAEAQFQRIHELDPADAEVLFQLALLAAARSQFAEAARRYRSALALTPENPYLWFHLGLTCRELPGELATALDALRRCIALKPDFADAHLLRGDALMDDSQLDEAIRHYREAIRLSPDNAKAHGNMGDAMLRKHLLDEAIRYYRRAAELSPDLVYVHFNLGTVYGIVGRHDQAMRCFEAVIKLRPDSASARGLLLFEMQRMCDWSRLDELCQLQRHSVVHQPEQEIHPFGLLSIPSTAAEQLACARNYAAFRSRAVARDRERLGFQFQRSARSRLRIGYLSADFREHPGAHLVAELLELHDRGRVDVFAYSYGPDDASAIRARLVRGLDRFVDISTVSHLDAASGIHRDQVDILVDLTGYTAYNRTEIAALRPAPIQVNFLGYPGTLGAEFIDYIVTDRFITPPGHARFLSEKPVYLPGSYQANDRKRSVAARPARQTLGLPEKSFVFCCFNQSNKILPGVFSAWMRLLQAVPDSVLWLVDNNSWATQNLRREATRHGIDPARLIFAAKCPVGEYRARLQAADLFLDTLPYNAHTTASDALWVGLPVLTCAGDTFSSRVAGSLLTAVGLPELITYTPEAYEALALRLARRPDELAALREKLMRNRATAPLFDTPAFARNLEAAYFRMWDNYLSGDGPREIAV